MSEKRFSEQYPGLNFNAYIPVKRLTQEEIDKYTGKKQEKENKSIAPNELIPSNVNEQEVQNDGNIENYTTQGKEDKSIAPNELIPSNVNEQEVQDDENMENYTTQGKEDKSIAPNELIPNMVISQEIQSEGNNSATNNYIPNIIIKQEIQYDVNMEEAQEMENLPNISNEFIPVEIKQEIPDEFYDDYYNNYNIDPYSENTFDESTNNYLPNIFDQENNYNMEMNTVPEYMNSNSSMDYIPNMINGSEIQSNTNMENYIPQANVNMPSSSIGFNPIRIKQEFPNCTTEIYSSREEYINIFVPNRSGQSSTQDDRNMETNISQEEYINNLVPNRSGQNSTQDDRNMETNTSQEEYINNLVPNRSGQSSSQDDRNMETNTSQEEYINNLVPNRSGQSSTQDDRNMETNTSQRLENKSTPSSTSGSVPNNIIIKQEILDDGNIEIYTDVLMPSMDLGYEDGTPW